MAKIVIKFLQGSVVTQAVLGGLTAHLLVADFSVVCVCQKYETVVSRQSYCNIK